MNSKIFELRKQPALIIELEQNRFKLTDAEHQSVSGYYEYDSLLSVSQVPSKTNWFVTLLSFILAFFTDLDASDRYRDRDKLRLEFDSNSIEIDLDGIEIEPVQQLVNDLNSRVFQ